VIGSQDLLVVLAIGVFFFGAKRLPELSRSLGQALSEFKKGVTSGVPENTGGGEAPKPGPAARPAKDDGPAGA
jgi:TatA/E family protein of Tat protein translocase